MESADQPMEVRQNNQIIRIPISSTPKPEKGTKSSKSSKKKTARSTPSSSPGVSATPGSSSKGSKRNRSTEQTTGFTPESKRVGLNDEALEAFGDFSSSSGLNTEEDSLNEIEKAIVGNQITLKRGNPSSEENSGPPLKEVRMAKRTGIEIRIFRKNAIYEDSLSPEDWGQVKDSVQEHMFDHGLLDMFDKIVSTPYNTQGTLSYGAITFRNTKDQDEMMALLQKFTFKFPVFLRPMKPIRFVIKFCIYGKVSVDPKKIVKAMLQLNGFKGREIECRTSTVDDVPGCRQFTLTSDEQLLEEFKAMEGQRLKTGFNATTFRIVDISNKINQE